MIKKTTAFFAILAVASFSSIALAGGGCGDKGGCDRDKSEAYSPASFDVAAGGCNGGSCGGKGDGDKS